MIAISYLRRTLRGLFAVLALIAAAATANGQSYTATDLGTLADGRYFPTGINNSGTVVGMYSLTQGGQTHSFIYSNGHMADIGSLGGGYCVATSINNAGTVVGNSTTADGASFGFIYSSGTMTVFYPPADNHDPVFPAWSQIGGINDAGVIVGQFSPGGLHSFGRAFDYRIGPVSAGQSRWDDLGTLGGNFSIAYGIDNAGIVVGESYTVGGDASSVHAFEYSNGVLTDLGTLGGQESGASGINEAGIVVGASTTINQDWQAFRFSNGIMTGLGFETARAINAAGVIVGAGNDYAYIYSNGTGTNLNSVVSLPHGVTLTAAYGINDSGQIAATGSDGHAYLLTPIPSSPADGTPAMPLWASAGLGVVLAAVGGRLLPRAVHGGA